MPHINLSYRTFIAPLTPVFIFITSWWIINSQYFTGSTDMLALGITIDLVFLSPLIYFMMVRKTNIPNITVVPVTVLCVVFASFILPVENQSYLNWIKSFILPLFELGVISFIIYKIILLNREFRRINESAPDFYSSLIPATKTIFPERVAHVFAAEIATLYYGLIHWKKRSLSINEFSYHRKSSGRTIFIVILLIIPVETFVFHLLIQMWSVAAAWIFTGIGIYSGLQVFGIYRSVPKRPHTLEENHLNLRYGIFQETKIPYYLIEKVERDQSDLSEEPQIAKLSLLGNLEPQNVIIHLKSEETLNRLWGMKKKYQTLAFHVDDPDKFINSLSEKIEE